MSLDRIHTDGANDTSHQDEDQHRLDAVIANLNSRVSAFEQTLESAVRAENQFHTNIQTLLDSLDAFVESHVEKDRHLTQLIEEDTQRSKEAKEEYDALASRFDDNLRKDNLTRTRDWLRTVSVYVGIVLSVVLMAPLHAFWWLLTRTLTRMGLVRSSEEPMIYSNARRRGRFVSSASEHSQAGTRHRRTQSAVAVSVPAESVPPRFSSVLKRNEVIKEHSKDYDSNDANDAKIKAPILGTDPTNAKESSDSEQSSASSIQINDVQDVGSNRENRDQPDMESEEEFFDARNDTEERVEPSEGTAPAQTEEEAPEEEENSGASDGSHRPGWAVPAGSDETLPDMSSFPSSDFWEISDEDIRLEVPQSDKISD